MKTFREFLTEAQIKIELADANDLVAYLKPFLKEFEKDGSTSEIYAQLKKLGANPQKFGNAVFSSADWIHKNQRNKEAQELIAWAKSKDVI